MSRPPLESFKLQILEEVGTEGFLRRDGQVLGRMISSVFDVVAVQEEDLASECLMDSLLQPLYKGDCAIAPAMAAAAAEAGS
jgi:hypothetical protein